ncbi:Ek otx/otd like protein [Sarcoptes scabiei]|nr:Ek otx/otd like protein [Sarcoptes scabiei]
MKTRKIRVSKNRKKYWRKYAPIDDVEEFLEAERFEERVGRKIVNAEDEDLFIIERKGDDQIYDEKFRKKFAENDPKKSKLQRIQDDHRRYQILESTSKISPIVIQRKNSDRKRSIHNDDNKLKKYWNDKKKLIEKAERIKRTKQQMNENPIDRFDFEYDVWDARDNKNAVKVPEHLRQKPSLLPAVEIPHPGQSYNPSSSDYQALIETEMQKEIQLIKEEKKLANKVDRYFVSKDQAPNEDTWLIEMSQGLFANANDQSENQNESVEQEQELLGIKLKQPKPKTKAQKRRALKEKMLRRQRKMAKIERSKENDIYRLKAIEQEICEQEKRSETRSKIRQLKHIQSLYKPKRLGKGPFEPIDTELSAPKELNGTLRSLRTKGSILQDRFKSFQKRNLIESSSTKAIQVATKTKPKLKKRFETKRRHRDE